MNILSKIQTALLIVVFVGTLSTGLFYLRQSARAAVTGYPFGGFADGVYYCSCSGSEILFFEPGFVGLVPAPLALMYVPGTEAYAWWNMGVPGLWSLGLFGPYWECWIPTVYPPCTLVYTAPLIEPIVGSSPF